MDWLIFGIVIGLGAWALAAWTRTRKLNLVWYEWVLIVIAVAFVLLAYQNYTATMAELEPEAGPFMLIAFGAPALVCALAAGFLVWRKQQHASPAPKS